MVGLLPVPHPIGKCRALCVSRVLCYAHAHTPMIVIRKYQPNKYTCLWFTVFQWGVIFMHNQAIPLYDSKAVKLFLVQTV
jgi:hypothetical protein